jgi:hypothetical protein
MLQTISPVNIPIKREVGKVTFAGISHLILKGTRRIRLRAMLDIKISHLMLRNLFLPRDTE